MQALSHDEYSDLINCALDFAKDGHLVAAQNLAEFLVEYNSWMLEQMEKKPVKQS